MAPSSVTAPSQKSIVAEQFLPSPLLPLQLFVRQLLHLNPKGTQLKIKLRNQKGKAVLDIEGIPLEQVLQLVEALSAELPSLSPGAKA